MIMKVAILSKDYMPLMYCDIKRAVVLVYLGKAEVVKATEKIMRSVSDAFQVPAVIRLLDKVKKKFSPKVVFTRKNVFMRDGYKCQYCGKESKKLTLDHVMPTSRGGKNVWENVVAACQGCNSTKSNRTPEEAGMPLLSKPKKPSMLIKIDWNNLFDLTPLQ
jgi:5-methylcytosine-specific restriction endonuclease McrA